jgi:hypothetical protein
LFPCLVNLRDNLESVLSILFLARRTFKLNWTETVDQSTLWFSRTVFN